VDTDPAPDLFAAGGLVGIMCQDCGRFYDGLAHLADHFAGHGRHGSECDRNRAADRAAGVLRLDVARFNRPPQNVTCSTCGGSGWCHLPVARGKILAECPTCLGAGTLEVADDYRPDPGA
jgi:hypothetical protein